MCKIEVTDTDGFDMDMTDTGQLNSQSHYMTDPRVEEAEVVTANREVVIQASKM